LGFVSRMIWGGERPRGFWTQDCRAKLRELGAQGPSERAGSNYCCGLVWGFVAPREKTGNMPSWVGQQNMHVGRDRSDGFPLAQKRTKKPPTQKKTPETKRCASRDRFLGLKQRTRGKGLPRTKKDTGSERGIAVEENLTKRGTPQLDQRKKESLHMGRPPEKTQIPKGEDGVTEQATFGRLPSERGHHAL